MKKCMMFIVLILVLSLLPCFPVLGAELQAEPAQQENVVLTDTEAFAKLEAFGIMTADDDIVSGQYVSRLQFVKYVMKCYTGNDLSLGSLSTESHFSDVELGTPGAAEVEVACDLGIISAANQFRPNDPITMNEAAKIILSVLGQEFKADSNGGYPTGYLALASKYKLFKYCSFTDEGYIPVSDFAQVLLNMLETDVFEVSAIKHNLVKYFFNYRTISYRTLLEYAFGICSTYGIVESNQYTSLYGISEMKEGYVEIGGIVYAANDTDADKLLGYNTEVYYSMDEHNTDRVIKYIAPYKNEVTTVESKNIANNAVTSSNFAYYDDAKDNVVNVSIPRNAILIYNGGQKSLSAEDLIPANGNVTLVDNNLDGETDIVFVMNYRTIQVLAVSPNSYRVSDILGGESIILDSNSNSYDVFIDVDGIPAEFDSIRPYNIISYAESTGCSKNIKIVKVSTKTVSGIPDEVGEESICIDGHKYDIDYNLAQSVSLKDYGFYYLDFNGKIVAKRSEKYVVHGYFNKIIKGNGLNETVFAQIFTENNRWVKLELKEKIQFNSGIDDNYVTKKAVDFYNDIWDGEPKLLTYTVTSDGKINMITYPREVYTQEYDESERLDVDNDLFRKHFESAEDLTYIHNSSDFRCFNTKGTSNTRFLVNSNTRVFSIPTDKDDFDNFTVMSADQLSTSTVYSNVIPYDYDEFSTASIVVLEAKSDVLSKTSSFMLVDSVGQALNSQDEATDAIFGYYKGMYITLATADNSVLSDPQHPISLEKGDVIRFKMNTSGDITGIWDSQQGEYSFYDYSKHKPGENDYIRSYNGTEYAADTSYNSSYMYVAGTAHYVDAEKNRFILDVNGQKLVQSVSASTAIYVYDYDKNKLTVGSLADMEFGDKKRANKVYLRNHYGVAREIIIYH